MEPYFPACSLQWVLPDPVLLSICVHWRELFPSWAHTPMGSLILAESTRCVDKHQVRTNEKKWESRVWDTATIAYQCPSTLSYKRYSVPGGGQSTKWHMMSSRQASCSRLETMVLFPLNTWKTGIYNIRWVEHSPWFCGPFNAAAARSSFLSKGMQQSACCCLYDGMPKDINSSFSAHKPTNCLYSDIPQLHVCSHLGSVFSKLYLSDVLFGNCLFGGAWDSKVGLLFFLN